MRNKLQYLLIQGDPNRNFLFQIAVSLKRSIFDPSLKAKMCFKSGGFFFYFQLFIYNFRLFVHNFRLFVYNFQKNPPLFKPILVFTTWGQIYIVSELWLFEIKNFDLGHPVAFGSISQVHILEHKSCLVLVLVYSLHNCISKNLFDFNCIIYQRNPEFHLDLIEKCNTCI